MRLQNTRDVLLAYLQNNGECSRIELAKALGITKATVTRYTTELISQGVIIENGETIDDIVKHLPKRGRRTVSIGINKNYKLVMGIVVFKEGICAGLTNLQGEILQKTWRYHEKDGQQSLLELIDSTYRLLLTENCLTQEHLIALSISIANGCDGICDGKNNVEQALKLKRDLSHAISVKIITCEFAGSSILAHLIFQNEVFSSAIMLMVGSPIGIGVFINNSLYEGASGNAGGLSLIGEALGLSDLQDTNRVDLLTEKILELFNFLDPQIIYVMGAFFEKGDFLSDINAKLLQLEKKHDIVPHNSIKASFIKRETAFLAPCAYAVHSMKLECFKNGK